MTIQVSTVSDGAATNGKGKGDRGAYLQHLLSLRSELSDSASWLQPIRDRATAQIQKLTLPSTRDEEWRFTDLSALLKVAFQPVSEQLAISPSDIQAFILPEAINSRLVFVNGIYNPALSDVDGLPSGVIVSTFSELEELPEKEDDTGLVDDAMQVAWREWAEEIATSFKIADGMIGTDFYAQANPPIAQGVLQQSAKEVFALLNSASMTDGTVVLVPRNQVVETPIQLLFVSTASQSIVSHPRVLVLAKSSSQLTLIEDFVALGEGVYFTNAVTDITIEDNADVRHTRVQRDSKQAFHIGTTTTFQASDSRYICNAISLGAQLSRHNLEVHQSGKQTETTLNGLTMIGDEQVADTHSLISFTKPHSNSRQVHKCIVDDRAHAVFNGKIFVPKPAQLTDARQLSSTLLLSEKARVDTKPQLEITADNVKCAHGATVSQLDSDEVFYLQSRGIDAESARRLLTYAFAYEVIREIPVTSLREKLATIVREQQA
jgi:Fe-S cluster assembly protein SufD